MYTEDHWISSIDSSLLEKLERIFICYFYEIARLNIKFGTIKSGDFRYFPELSICDSHSYPVLGGGI